LETSVENICCEIISADDMRVVTLSDTRHQYECYL